MKVSVDNPRKAKGRRESNEMSSKSSEKFAEILKRNSYKKRPGSGLFFWLSGLSVNFDSYSFLGTLFGIIFHVSLVLFSFTIPFSSDHFVETYLGKFSKTFRSIVFYTKEADPIDYFDSFLVQFSVFILVMCCIYYIAFILYRKNKYIGYFLRGFVFYFSEIFAFPFLVFLSTCSLSAIYYFILKNDTLYLIVPTISIFCFLALYHSVLRSITDIRMNRLAFNTSDPSLAWKWILTLLLFFFFSCIVEYTEDHSTMKSFTCFVMVVILVPAFYDIMKRPIFTVTLFQIFSSISTASMIINSLVELMHNLFPSLSADNISQMVSISNLTFSILTIAFILVRRNKYIELLHNNEIDPKNYSIDQIFLMLLYADSDWHQQRFNSGFISSVLNDHPEDLNVAVLFFRFKLMDRRSFSKTAKMALNLLSTNPSTFFESLQLSTLHEIVSETVYFCTNKTVVNQKQIKHIYNSCVSAHYRFWKAVLYENIGAISESLHMVEHSISVSKAFFDHIEINKNADQQFGISYFQYLTFLSSQIDVLPRLSSPFLLLNSFSRQPSTDLMEDVSQFREYPPLRIELNPEKIQSVARVKNVEFGLYNCRLYLFGFFKWCLIVLYFVSFAILMSDGYFIYNSPNLINELFQARRFFVNVTGVVVENVFGDYLNISSRMSEESKSKSWVIQNLDNSRIMLKSNSFFVESINITEFELLFDSFKELVLLNYSFNNHTTYEEASFCELFYYVSRNTVTITNKMIESMAILRDGFDQDLVTFMDTLKDSKYHISFLSMIIIIIVLIICFQHRKYFIKLLWQVLYTPKSEVSLVFQGYSKITESKVLRESNMEEPHSRFPYHDRFTVGLIVLYVFSYILFLGYQELSKYLFNEYSSLIHSFINSNSIGPVVQMSSMLIPTALTNSCGRPNVFDSMYSIIKIIRSITGFDTNITYNQTLNSSFPLVSVRRADNIINDWLFPLSNTSISYRYLFYLSSITISLSEILVLKGNTPQDVYLEHFRNVLEMRYLSRLFYDVMSKDISYYISQMQSYIKYASTLYILTQCFIGIYVTIMIIKNRNTLQCFLRVLLTITSSPSLSIDESGVLTVIDEPPDYHPRDLVDSFPLGICIVDSNHSIVYANNSAQNMFGVDLVGQQDSFINTPIFIDSSGNQKYFTTTKLSMRFFPDDCSVFRDSGEFFFVITDITLIKTSEMRLKECQNDIERIQRTIIPQTSLINSQIYDSGIVVLSDFAVVEIFIPHSIGENYFHDLKEIFYNFGESYSTLFYFGIQRSSIFAFFGRASSVLHILEHTRDSVLFALEAHKVLQSRHEFSESKIAVAVGNQCLCEIIQQDTFSLSLFSQSLYKPASLLRYIQPGEIIIEKPLAAFIKSGLMTAKRLVYVSLFGKDVLAIVYSNNRA